MLNQEMKRSILLLVVYFRIHWLSAQEPVVVWNNTYGNQPDRVGKAIEWIGENQLLTLSECCYGKGVLSSHDTTGKLIWEKYFEDERINQIIAGKDCFIATGYKYSKRGIWIAKFDVKGEKSWERWIRIKHDDEGEALAITEENDILILATVTKAVLPVRITFKAGLRHVIGFRSRTRMSFDNQMAMLKFNAEGQRQWRRVFGKSGKGFFSPVNIAVAKTSQICVASAYSEPAKGHGTLVVSLTPNGKKVFNAYLKEYRAGPVIFHSNSFWLAGSNSSSKAFKPDTVSIWQLSGQHQLKEVYAVASRFDEVEVKALQLDAQNNFILAGSAFDMKYQGGLTENHHENWLLKVSSGGKKLWEWNNTKLSIDKVNDMVVRGEEIFTVGESWSKEATDRILQEMRLMKITEYRR